MLCCHQISTQSLEAIVLIVAKSAGRISESCMHVSMQIQVGSVSCTLPAPHRPVPTCLHRSSPCYQGMGARITPPTPLFSHSTTLDNSESNSSNCNGCLFLLRLHQTTCVILLFLSACRLAPKPNCRRRGPKTPRTYAPPAVAVWSPFLVTLWDASASLQHLQASLHRQIQTTRTE